MRPLLLAICAACACQWIEGCSAPPQVVPRPGQPVPGSPTRALDVIRHMEDMYAHLTSYSDSGDSSGDPKISFRTLYKAPGKFYFAYTEHASGYFPAHTYYMCASGKRDPAYDPKRHGNAWLAKAYVVGKVEEKPLDLEIAGFTSITRGVAYMVPTMLFPDSGSFHLHDLHDASLLGPKSFDGLSCYLVESRTPEMTLWIDAKTYALRKLERRIVGGETLITTYKPVLNPKIEDLSFIFRAPAKK